MKNNWIKDKVNVLILGALLCFFVLIPFAFIVSKLMDKYNRLSFLFFFETPGYITIFSWIIIKQIKKLRKLKFIIGFIIMIIIEIFAISFFFILNYYGVIKDPQYGGMWFGALILFLMLIVSYYLFYFSFNQAINIAKKIKRKKKREKDIIEFDKFQEKARKKILEVLKSTGAEYEEFKKIEKENEIFLQSNIEINGRPFMIEISEEAITLAAEREEDAFILELIDFQNSNQLIDEFCKKTKEIFKKIK